MTFHCLSLPFRRPILLHFLAQLWEQATGAAVEAGAGGGAAEDEQELF